jgi:hypothetical protein
MRNDHLPLIAALKGHRPPSVGPPALEPVPRTFELQHSDIPGLAAKHVGEPLTVKLQGHVHMQHADGHAVMHVSSVKPDSAELIQKEYSGQKAG